MATTPPLPAAAESAAASSVGSSTTAGSPPLSSRRPLARSTSAIEGLLEGRRADPAPSGQEVFAVAAVGEVGGNDGVDGIRHGFSPEAGADDGTDRSIILGATAKRNLIELGALLIDAEDADIARVMMAAGIDAARHIEAQRPDLLLALQI